MPGRLRDRATLLALASTLLLAGCGGDEENSSPPAEPFQPLASLTAIGGTERTDKPALALRVETRPGDANIRSARLILPAAFIVDQSALGNMCSEGELKADRCAGRKRLGAARVVSPAYRGPLAGPVYPVSGSGGLPRLAYVLEGPAEILLRGRIAVRGIRIEAGIEDVPNVPLEVFELRIDGGAPGYLVLSHDICRRRATADVSFVSQTGETFERRVPLEADCDS